MVEISLTSCDFPDMELESFHLDWDALHGVGNISVTWIGMLCMEWAIYLSSLLFSQLLP